MKKKTEEQEKDCVVWNAGERKEEWKAAIREKRTMAVKTEEIGP